MPVESTISSTASSTATTIDPIVASFQATALKELQKFTGDPTQKVTHFINAIEQLRTFTPLNDVMLHAVATLKLGGSAFNWYDNNKDSLNSWPLLKNGLLTRFKPSLSAAKTRLKDRRQQPGEALVTYYDDVIDLCKQVDEQMPLHMIVDYLQDGISDALKIHVKRQLKALKEEPTPAMFLKIAQDEEELQKEVFSEHPPHFASSQPYFPRLVAATGKSFSVSERSNRSPVPNDPRIHHPQSYSSNNFRFSQSRQQVARPQRYPCLICGQTTHRTIDCYKKQPQGCYKCGDYNHYIRDCPQVFR